MYAYGIYLMHGGDPGKFAELTQDEIQILLTTYTGTIKQITDVIFKMLKAMLGAGNDR